MLQGGGAVAGGETIDPEQEHGADDGEDDAPQGEAVEAGTGDQVADETADEGTDDADDDRHDDAPRILPGHERLGDRTSDQSEHDPSEDTHSTASNGGSGRRRFLTQRAYQIRMRALGGGRSGRQDVRTSGTWSRHPDIPPSRPPCASRYHSAPWPPPSLPTLPTKTSARDATTGASCGGSSTTCGRTRASWPARSCSS